jgi:hypothetical protein
MKWTAQNINLLFPFIGLIFDIIGAWLVACEVVVQYKGERFISPQTTVADMTDTSKLPEATEHPQYKLYEIKKYQKMKYGLAFLTIGFIIQMIPYF